MGILHAAHNMKSIYTLIQTPNNTCDLYNTTQEDGQREVAEEEPTERHGLHPGYHPSSTCPNLFFA